MQFCVTKSMLMFLHTSPALSRQIVRLYFIIGLALCCYGALSGNTTVTPLDKDVTAVGRADAELTVYVHLFQ
jgi:hypothetical protein